MSAALPPRRMRGKLIAAGVLFYLLFLVIQTPVSWLIAQLPANSPIQLRQASGAPWQGEVRQVTWKVDDDRLELGSLNWRWMPGELLDGRIGLNFELGKLPHKLAGNVLLSNKGLSLKNLQGQADAALLGFASRPMSLLQPRGSLAIDVPELFLSDTPQDGEIEAETP